jgi:uncharacterized protein YjbJ (UPF0337 family)
MPEQERTGGLFDKVKGKVKQAAGSVLGDRDLEAGEAQLKDLREHAQTAVPLDTLVQTLQEKLL